MNKTTEPAVFLGLLRDLRSGLSEDYFFTIKPFFNNHNQKRFIWIEISEEIPAGEYSIFFGSKSVKMNFHDRLHSIMSQFGYKSSYEQKISNHLEKYVLNAGINKESIISIIINETESQKLIHQHP